MCFVVGTNEKQSMDTLPDGVVSLIASSLTQRDRIRALLVCWQWWPALLRTVVYENRSLAWVLMQGHTEHLTVHGHGARHVHSLPNHMWLDLVCARALRTLRVDACVGVGQLQTLREANPGMSGSLNVRCTSVEEVTLAAADPCVDAVTLSCANASAWVPDLLPALACTVRRVFIRDGWLEDSQSERLVASLDGMRVMDAFTVSIDCPIALLCDFFRRVPARTLVVDFRCYGFSAHDVRAVVDSILANEHIGEVGGDSLRAMFAYTLATADEHPVTFRAMRSLMPRASSLLALDQYPAV